MKAFDLYAFLAAMFIMGGIGLLMSYVLRKVSTQLKAPIHMINEFDKDLIKADNRIGIIGLLMFFGGLGFLLLGGYV